MTDPEREEARRVVEQAWARAEERVTRILRFLTGKGNTDD